MSLVSEVLDSTRQESTRREKTDTGAVEFTSEVRILQQLISRVSSVVPPKDTKPVLKNIQLIVASNFIQVYSTNLELSVVVNSSDIASTITGSVLLPTKKLSDVLSGAESGPVLVSVDNGSARIEAGRASWDLVLHQETNYPPLPDVTGLVLHDIDKEVFVRGLNAVRYAAARDASRSAPALMMVSINKGKMTACDGARFQQFDLGLDFPLSLDIPTKALDELLRVLQWDGDTVRVGETARHLVFHTPMGTLIVNKLSARFPDMEQTLLRPSLSNNRELSIDLKSLVSAIKRVRINADPTTSALGLSLSLNKLILSARDKFGNEAQEIIDVSWLGDNYNITVNHSYLLEMLQMHEEDTCKFRLGNDTSTKKAPILLQGDRAVGVVPQMNSDWVDVLQR